MRRIREERPGNAVVILPAGAREWGFVGALHDTRSAGQRVVSHPLGDGGAVGYVAHILPAEVAFAQLAVRRADAGPGGLGATLARQGERWLRGYTSRFSLYKHCKDFKIFLGVKQAAKKTPLLKHLDVFKPQ